MRDRGSGDHSYLSLRLDENGYLSPDQKEEEMSTKRKYYSPGRKLSEQAPNYNETFLRRKNVNVDTKAIT